VDHVLNWLWQGSAIALATLAALRLLDRSRAPFRYVLCGIALLAVLALPVVSLLWSRTPAWEAIADTPMPTTPVLAIPIAWWTSGAVIAGLWGLWCVICVGRVIASTVAVRRARRQSRPFPAALESRLTFWNEVRGRGRRTRLVVSSGVPAAAVLGWGSPVIAVAPAFVRQLGDEEIDRAVIHEWAHVQRYDDLLNLLQIAVLAVAGWHPAVWWLERQLRIEREVACDEMAVSLTGNPKRYAASLTAMATLLPVRHHPASAVGVFSSPTLRTRILRILSTNTLATAKWSATRVVVVVVALAVFALGLTRVRLVARAMPQQPEVVVQPLPVAPPVTVVRPVASPVPYPDVDRGRRADAQPGASRPRRKPVRQLPLVAVDPGSLATPPAPAQDEPVKSVKEERPPDRPAVTAPPVHPPTSSSTKAPTDASEPPWTTAADAGVAIGRGSQKAGVATASFFSRLGKKIAGSF
jgi:serine-type D-Ala-D-Ala endopeptidase (penicillin-binding protein 7)